MTEPSDGCAPSGTGSRAATTWGPSCPRSAQGVVRQWKAVEKSIADVFDQKEKEEIKAGYEKEIAKIDWDKWETNLKQVYDKIDWDKINTQFSTALNQVRMDSIQVVYNKAIRKLDIVRKELRQSGLKGIPDSDITLKELEQKKTEVQKALLKLNAERSKKIVHL